MTEDLPLNYDYTASKIYCEHVCGLVWMPWMLVNPDADAFRLKLTQEQVATLMRHHLWNVKILFDPKTYTFVQRILLAIYFLTRWKPKQRISL